MAMLKDMPWAWGIAPSFIVTAWLSVFCVNETFSIGLLQNVSQLVFYLSCCTLCWLLARRLNMRKWRYSNTSYLFTYSIVSCIGVFLATITFDDKLILDIVCLLGIALCSSGGLGIIVMWWERYAQLEPPKTIVLLCVNVIVACFFTFLISIIPAAYSGLRVLIVTLFVVCSAVLLSRSWKKQKHDISKPFVSGQRMHIRGPLVGGLLVYGIFTGYYGSLSNLFLTSPHNFETIIIGVSLVSLTLLLGAIFFKSIKNLDFNYVRFSLLLFSVSSLLIILFCYVCKEATWVCSLIAVLNYLFAVPILLFILCKTIANQVPVSSIEILLPLTLILLVGCFCGCVIVSTAQVLFGQESGPLYFVAAIIIVLLLLANELFFSREQEDSLWGLVPKRENISAGNITEARASNVAKNFGLTPREKEVFVLLVNGEDAHTISDELGVSITTTRTHIKHIYILKWTCILKQN